MYKLRDCYIKNEYRNRTINKQVTMLKEVLKWLNTREGYECQKQCLTLKPN